MDLVYINENFDSLYNGNNTYIVKQAGNTSSHTVLKNGDGTLSFCVGPRTNGAGDGTTGFKAYTEGADKYIAAVSGQFSSSNRHPYLSLDAMPKFAELDNTRPLEMRFSILMNPSNDSAKVDFNDGSKSAFVFKTENNKLYISNENEWTQIGDKNKWYDINILFDTGFSSFEINVSENGNTVYYGSVSCKEDVLGISRIDFGKDVADADCVAYMDNLMIIQKSVIQEPFECSQEINDDTYIGAEITPNQDYGEKFTVIAAHYENDKFIQMQIITDLTSDTEIKFKKTGESDTVKLFAWDGLDTMIPLTDPILIDGTLK